MSDPLDDESVTGQGGGIPYAPRSQFTVLLGSVERRERHRNCTSLYFFRNRQDFVRQLSRSGVLSFYLRKNVFMAYSMKENILALLKNKRALFKAERIIFIALVIAFLVGAFVIQPFIVAGDSMIPTYGSGDYLIIDRLSYTFKKPQRGDVIVFHYPLDPSLYLIKRIGALPGEAVEEASGEIVASSSVLTQDREPSHATSTRKILLARDEYFVLGDNSAESSDSRAWGPLQNKFIVGRILLRAWPLFEK